jgi:hypothetical protein
MAQGDQVRNGKAFEYALAIVYAEKIKTFGRNVALKENSALSVARGYYDQMPEDEKERYREAASQTIDTMVRIEPGLTAQKDECRQHAEHDSGRRMGDKLPPAQCIHRCGEVLEV